MSGENIKTILANFVTSATSRVENCNHWDQVKHGDIIVKLICNQ